MYKTYLLFWNMQIKRIKEWTTTKKNSSIFNIKQQTCIIFPASKSFMLYVIILLLLLLFCTLYELGYNCKQDAYVMLMCLTLKSHCTLFSYVRDAFGFIVSKKKNKPDIPNAHHLFDIFSLQNGGSVHKYYMHVSAHSLSSSLSLSHSLLLFNFSFIFCERVAKIFIIHSFAFFVPYLFGLVFSTMGIPSFLNIHSPCVSCKYTTYEHCAWCQAFDTPNN